MQCHAQEHIAKLSPAERLSMVGTSLSTDPRPEGALPAVPQSPVADAPPTRPGLFVTPQAIATSVHKDVKCVECHQDAERLPHSPKLNLTTCATACHSTEANAYAGGAHMKALTESNRLAPNCVTCHGGHDIAPISDAKANHSRLKSLFLCGDCHKQHQPNGDGSDPATRVSDYLASTHARAVTNSGLISAAMCADCHGAHRVLPSADPASSVHRSNVPDTCGTCHVGVAETYATSVHGKAHSKNNGEAAVCSDCHTAHSITRASSPEFMLDVINECGHCHDSPDATGDRVGTYYETYNRSYHGQVTHLGATRAARCSDCHGSHDIRPLDDPSSRVSEQNLVNTCGQCHPGANAKFVQFDPHANHLDAKNYPLLHGIWLYFIIMMSGVFTFFGLHTLLWLIRSLIERAKHGKPAKHPHATTAIRRFTTLDRVNHALVLITFFGLTATGIPLVFAQQPWAKKLAYLFGGIEAAGLWHRFFAILLIANFVLHFIGLGRAFRKRTVSWHRWLFGPNSLVPRWKDVKDCLGMFGWFFGRRRPPRFDRWTYWEKFDYWAEVFGSMIIGGTGLLLWFPELAAKVVPGWFFNVAMIVHGYEALLAIGFIFTIHFFNAHVRPGTFPVDEVIFTGSVPEHELKEQRPEEYERLVATGRLESLRVTASCRKRRPMLILIAFVCVSVGVTLLMLIILGGLRVLD